MGFRLDDYATLIVQQIAHKAGWEQGKREALDWALHALRMADYSDAAEFLEGLVFGEAVLRIKQTEGFKRGQHPTVDKAEKVQAPDTTVRWSRKEPDGDDASHNGPT